MKAGVENDIFESEKGSGYGEPPYIFLQKKKKKPSLMRSPVNTAECFWPIGHRINGVPLYIISTRDTCCCYIVVLIPVLNILGAVQL